LNNHTNVPVTNSELGRWVIYQQRRYNQGKLPSDRINRLEEIDFNFNPDKSAWLRQLHLLFDYKEVNGDTNVPSSKSGFGKWVSKQRLLCNQGKQPSERFNLLNDIGFNYTTRNHKNNWNKNFQLLINYKKVNGDTNVPRSRGLGSTNVPQKQVGLVSWVATQRHRTIISIYWMVLVSNLPLRKK